MRVIFFGSFQHYSAYILQALIDAPDIEVVGVVTTPPMPVGRQQIITKTPVHLLAESHHLPVFTPSKLSSAPANDARSRTPPWRQGVEDVDLRDEIKDVDYFITAGYGKILPQCWLDYPAKGCLNLHFSLLPAYRGANPAEWAIMCGETQTGITLIEMSDKLDAGDILYQAAIDIEPTDSRETLYDKLYRLGAAKLPTWLLQYDAICGANEDRRRTPLAGSEDLDLHQNCKKKQPATSLTPYAALLKRDDGYLPWPTLQAALRGQTLKITDFPSKHLQRALLYTIGRGRSFQHADMSSQLPPGADDASTAKPTDANTQIARQFFFRLPRALAGYPSLWTIVPTTKGDKRLKILSFDLSLKTNDLTLGLVQLEGHQPCPYNQIKNQIVVK